MDTLHALPERWRDPEAPSAGPSLDGIRLIPEGVTVHPDIRSSCPLCLPGRVLDESLLLPPSGNGDADGRSIVFLDEVDAGADVLDLEGGYVILAPPDCRGGHDRARIEGEQG